MSLSVNNSLRSKTSFKVVRALFYLLLGAIAVFVYLFLNEQDKLTKIRAKVVRLQGLESELEYLKINNNTPAEERRIHALSHEKVFHTWYDFASWLEILRTEAKRREIEFRYSFRDTPAASNQLTAIECTFILGSAKEGYARFINFISFICDVEEYQINLQQLTMTKGETVGIKECKLHVICWIER